MCFLIQPTSFLVMELSGYLQNGVELFHWVWGNNPCVRVILVFFYSALAVLVFGKLFIGLMGRWGFVECVDMRGHPGLEKIHAYKNGTSTIGGVLMGIVFVVVLLFSSPKNSSFWVLLIGSFWFLLIGLLDDLLKIKRRKGLNRLSKLVLQVLGGVLVSSIYLRFATVSGGEPLFFADIVPGLLWMTLIITASCNAVNLTDGSDGLAGGCVAIIAVMFAITGTISEVGPFVEMGVVSGALAGICVGFLFFNLYPAKLFMGDSGASFLGFLLGMIAILSDREFELFIVGLILVVEVLSVILQVFGRIVLKRRVLIASPLHHHFKLLGWSEYRIAGISWFITGGLALWVVWVEMA